MDALLLPAPSLARQGGESFSAYHNHVRAPQKSDAWLVLTPEELSVGEFYDWCVQPSCGAGVVFSGTVRDHAEGREGVSLLEYEAYEEHVEPRLEAIAVEMRNKWPNLSRVVLAHRTGALKVGESSVVVAVSSPHRPDAFEAARFGIDTLKATVPIWKREVWKDGEDWALSSQDITDVRSTDSVGKD